MVALITDWAGTLGLMEIRADPQHSFVAGATVDPTEESCGVLHEQLSMLVAQFGIKFPNGSKFKVGTSCTFAWPFQINFFADLIE